MAGAICPRFLLKLRLKLRRIGRVDVLPERAVTSTRRYERNGPIRTALRNALFVGLFYLGVPPRWLARGYAKESSV